MVQRGVRRVPGQQPLQAGAVRSGLAHPSKAETPRTVNSLSVRSRCSRCMVPGQRGTRCTAHTRLSSVSTHPRNSIHRPVGGTLCPPTRRACTPATGGWRLGRGVPTAPGGSTTSPCSQSHRDGRPPNGRAGDSLLCHDRRRTHRTAATSPCGPPNHGHRLERVARAYQQGSTMRNSRRRTRGRRGTLAGRWGSQSRPRRTVWGWRGQAPPLSAATTTRTSCCSPRYREQITEAGTTEPFGGAKKKLHAQGAEPSEPAAHLPPEFQW